MKSTTRSSINRMAPRRAAGVIQTGAALAIGGLCLASGSVVAQQAPLQLPGIVVQGASISPPAPRRSPPIEEIVDAVPAPAPARPRRPRPVAQAPVAAAASTAAGGDGGSESTAAAAGPVEGGGGGAGGAGNGQAVETVGSAVTVVSGDTLVRQQVRHAADALRSLPGVTVNRGGGFGAQTQVRLRGAEANHTLVLIDGIVANDTTTGSFDFSDLSAEHIERIEVLRGPHSGLYGSNALGGVVNIVTKGGRGPLQATLRSEAGSFGTFDYSARVSGGTDRAWGALGYHERHATGFNVAPIGFEKDGATLKTISVRGGVRLLDGVTLDFTLRHSDKSGDRDTEGGSVGTLAVQVDDPSTFSSRVFLGGVNLRWDTLDGAVTHIVRASRNETRTIDVSPTFLSRNFSETHRVGYLGTVRFATPSLFGARHSVTGLVEKEDEAFLPLSDFADGLERSRGRLATALEYRGDIGRLHLGANVRHDDNDTFRDFSTWRLAASLRFPEIGLRPHASVGTAVKLPTMFENFGFIPGSFTPNPNLTPEESQGWDAGIEATFWSGRAVLDVTYFEQDLRNKIDGFAPGPGFTFTAVNLPGTSRRDGVEVAARLALSPALALAGAYTYLTAQDATGLDEIRRPRHAARADLTYLFAQGRGTAGLAVIYNGSMADTAFRINAYSFGFPITSAERVGLGDYWLVNASVAYRLTPGVEVFGRVENLLDQRYFEIYGFETPGVAAYAGVKLTLGGGSIPETGAAPSFK